MTSDVQPQDGQSAEEPKPVEDSPKTDSASSADNPLVQLQASFAKIADLKDPIQQEYELLQQAKRFRIPPDSYRRLFEEYLDSGVAVSQTSLLKPLRMMDKRLGDFIEECQNLSLLQLAGLVSQVTLLIALVSYVFEGPQRHQQAINDARNAITERVDQPYSQDRVEAFEFLNKNCVPIVGFTAEKASMPKLKLNQCYEWQFNLQSFAQFPPNFWRYRGADLSNMNLVGADLKGANLTGANLAGIDLTGANLEGAILTGATLTGAKLDGAKLDRIHLNNANLNGATLKNAQISRANLVNTTFNQADLTNANLLWTDLSRSKFYRATLKGANLSRTNLQNADLYRANLENASLGYADLRQRTNLREASLKGADLRATRFWSADQLRRSRGWDKTARDPNWIAKITQPQKTPKIGLIASPGETIFDTYFLGMQSVPGAEVILERKRIPGLEEEVRVIQELIKKEVDVIFIRPRDPQDSVLALRKAYEQGIAIITIGDCINPTDSARYVFACFESESFAMGYDSTRAMTNLLGQQIKGRTINLAVVDGAIVGRLYPYFLGFEQAMRDSGLPWQEVASTDASEESDAVKIKAMLKANPNIDAIWAGSDTTTAASVQAVQGLGLSKKVMVFGILDLTAEKGNWLLNPTHPLQSIVDQQPAKVGKAATERALAVLQRQDLNYQRVVIPHEVLGQSDTDKVRQRVQALKELQNE